MTPTRGRASCRLDLDLFSLFSVRSALSPPDVMLLFCPQNVLPVEYGSGYDAVLQSLAWEFLTRVDELLFVPNLKEVRLYLA